ncbi:MAG: NADH-quinone oxidoreductase subunit N [Candidatus Omnitrophica bacterium]|nr:NADH-quinone oxidoreductase subunit N [Candidatus Omnitrophota bacterium]
MDPISSLQLFIPELILLTGAFLTLILDLFIKNKRTVAMAALIVLGITALSLETPEGSPSLFYGFFMLDRFTHFFRCLALGIVGLTILASLRYHEKLESAEGEYYSLFLLMAFGLISMGAASNLLMIFLAIEFVSLLSYLLVGFLKESPHSKEAAIKYLLFGSLASGIMLYGMSLLYGITGSLELSAIHRSILNPEFSPIALAAILLMFAGLGFKISMAPFHMWAPDVYQAAPTPVTGFLTVGPKALGFAVLIRVLTSAFYDIDWQWSVLITVLSILTMTIGNIVAIAQTNIKRLLAYSSIAQAGYILMGIAVFQKTGLTAILIYLLAYAFTNLGAFIAVIMASNHFKDDYLESYQGLARRSPVLAASMTIFLLSLAGIPPLAGFIGKFFVFSAAIEAKMITLAVAAALNSAVAAYYYFKVIRIMYLVEPTEWDQGPLPQPVSLKIALGLTLAGTVLIGLFPAPFITWIQGIF